MSKIAVIPARSGSKRLPKKNYKPFNSRTLVEIARDKCLATGIFDKVIISSDDPVFEKLKNCKEVEFLLRNENLSGVMTQQQIWWLIFSLKSYLHAILFFGSTVLVHFNQCKILKTVAFV